jgi:phosphoribosylamine-glycine ligase
MVKVLLLDTNISSYPIYKFLIYKKFEVYVVGNNPNDYLSKVSDNYYNLDYTKNIILLEFVRKHNFKYVIPGCNDASYLALSKLSESYKVYGVDHFDNTNLLLNKLKFKKIANDLNINVPKNYNYGEKYLNEKIIIKPVDSYSGKGVNVINTSLARREINHFIDIAKNNSNSNDYIIEDFIDGQLYSHSAFIKDKKIYIDFIVEEYCNTYKYAVDSSFLKNNFNKKYLNNLRFWIEKLIKELNLVDGLIHTQFIIQNKNIWIIEITRRCPGDLYSRLIELTNGFKYSNLYCSFFIDSFFLETNMFPVNKFILRKTISTSSKMFFTNIYFNKPLKINEFYPILNSGSELKNSSFNKVGLIFLEYNNCKELNRNKFLEITIN